MLRLLDLFCGEGGAGWGYALAGFAVTGVDRDAVRGRRYPFPFVHGDALEYLREHGRDYDAIHASPPCQAYSVATKGTPGAVHPDLVGTVREELERIGRPWVIENVTAAPLREPLVLCGTMFGLVAADPDTGWALNLRRHRGFESDVPLAAPGPCRCREYREAGYVVGGVYGGGGSNRTRTRGGVSRGGYTPATPARRELIGAPWMSMAGLSQAVPPAYTKHVGKQLARHVRAWGRPRGGP